MGNADTKLNFRKAVVQLTSKTQVIDSSDDIFWDQFWSENVTNVQDIFTLIPAPEIRILREEAPSNLATLCYKAVEKLVKAVDNSCRTQREHQTVLNCCRLLTRLLPYIFEDPDWKGFFWSSLPGKDDDESLPLAHSLLNAISDLLFCPDFTVAANRKSGPDKVDELQSIDSCEYIWEAGVGFAYSPPRYPILDSNRTELLKLLLTCFSETMYNPPMDLSITPNKWIQHLTSSENRHALPMFTSLLNTVCAYDPVGYGVPYNHLLFTDSLEPLVDVALQILIVTLDHDTTGGAPLEEGAVGDNLFINYLSRIHRDEARVGLMHIGVFILLLLSGERNFGVRLNKPYTATVPMDIPVFTGTHADLLVTVFHKIITTGHQRLQPLFDCLLTILVNVSPYLKTLSMVASTKLLHLLEAFSTPWFLFSAPTNHHLVFFLLEIFNNIIQYQFDGNSNLVYTIIRKRQVFHALANLPSDCNTIAKSLSKRQRRHMPASTSNENVSETAMEGSHPAQPAEPGTLKASLLETPGIEKMTEKESAHPLSPSASVDIGKSIGNRSESKTDIAEESMNATKNSVVPKGGIRVAEQANANVDNMNQWVPSSEWVWQWKSKLPLQTIMRLLQVLVPQVEKICIDKGLTDESEILKFLQHGTLVGLLPVPHPILIRRYQANAGTTAWFRTYMWGVIYLRNVEPPIWYDTDVKLFEIQRV
ncbi:transmembrane protein [Lasius niger]|uniref:Transmembrane protein n=1 Tax=Lasius niger TaxID=67767 RepID=A0A0J7KMG6_LASNI|nr:transmembrane protein [Lasius niger]